MRPPVLQVAAAVAGLLGVVDAQGYFGTVAAQEASCPLDDFVYLGCYHNFLATAGNEFFNFSPQGPNPADPSRSFPGWDPGSDIDSTVTPIDCAQVCRGYGYKFAAVRDNSCTCGIQMPAGYAPGPASACNRPCNGDASQTCGGGLEAQVYLDPSFAANEEVPITNSNPAIASYYEYLGCYNNPRGFPTQDSRASALVADIDACFNLCAGLGYPLVHGAPDSGQVRCSCGTVFGYESHRLDVELLATPICNTTCDAEPGVLGDCDVTSQRCCGRNNVYPVYINTQLQGCFTPVIPGIKSSPADPVFECVDVPDDLTGPPTELDQPVVDPADTIDSDPALLRPPVIEVEEGRTYYIYGCSGLLPSALFILGGIPVPGVSPVTLQGCANACNAIGYNAFGMSGGQNCFCSPGLLLPLTPPIAMRFCNVPCAGDDSVACGTDLTPIVYTTNSGLGIYPDIEALPPAPRYECESEATTTRTTTTTTTTTTTSTSTTLTTETSITTTETTTTSVSTEETTTTTTSTSISTEETTTTSVSTEETTTTSISTEETTTTSVSTEETTTTSISTEETTTTTTSTSTIPETETETTTTTSTSTIPETETSTTTTTTTSTSTIPETTTTGTSTTSTTTTDISTTSTTTTATTSTTTTDISTTSTTTTTTTTTSSTSTDGTTTTSFTTTTRTRTRVTYTTVTTAYPWPPYPYPPWYPYPIGDGNEPWTGGGWDNPPSGGGGWPWPWPGDGDGPAPGPGNGDGNGNGNGDGNGDGNGPAPGPGNGDGNGDGNGPGNGDGNGDGDGDGNGNGDTGTDPFPPPPPPPPPPGGIGGGDGNDPWTGGGWGDAPGGSDGGWGGAPGGPGGGWDDVPGGSDGGWGDVSDGPGGGWGGDGNGPWAGWDQVPGGAAGWDAAPASAEVRKTKMRKRKRAGQTTRRQGGAL